MKRLLLKINGQVQGVGFRPHVYRLATRLKLTGWVRNDSEGVTIEIQGELVTEFLAHIFTNLPPLAKINELTYTPIKLVQGEKDFSIVKSKKGKLLAKISPDVTLCPECLHELFSENNRFYMYPFINCMHCGPRYTIVRSLPYDRAATSMSAFKMCATCNAEYSNPENRRYHAQPVACQNCGPQLSLSIKEIAAKIALGKIIALKGLGGYQLICDARNEVALRRLRNNKKRSEKPFAIMALNEKSVAQFAIFSNTEQKYLTSLERPIVLLPRLENKLPEAIAPNLKTVGVMLPYTPIHYLLFHSLLGMPAGTNWLEEICHQVMVVTSANLSGTPLIKDDEIAKEQLKDIADEIVTYNREIVTRVDDSVLSVIHDKPCYIRRARGYVPTPIPLPYEIPSTLALGASQKNTICVTRGKEAYLSQHIGDLNNRESIEFYHETIRSLLKLLDVKPDCVACDLHKDFYSSRIAAAFDVPIFSIQHHYAHLAASTIEDPSCYEAIGLALDGFGLGEHHENWGGELLYSKLTHYERLGSLKPIMQPGGDIAARQPWRMAASILFELGEEKLMLKRFKHHACAAMLLELLKKRVCAPLTSSCGRLFDAASALLGVCEITNYDGQAAMELESKVTNPKEIVEGFRIDFNQLNFLPLFRCLLECDATDGANYFHGTLIAGLATWLEQNAERLNITHIVLGGGCFLNKILSDKLVKRLSDRGYTVIFPQRSPPNDGGISLGQAWIAGNKMRGKTLCV